jgi:hypothetical protein
MHERKRHHPDPHPCVRPPYRPLTANLATIVFVLTLTHMVFMTFNWRHIIQKKEVSVEKAWLKAVRVTLLPSF